MADIKLSHKIKNDEYTEYVYNTFDIQDREQTSVTIPMKIGDLDKFEWNIGVIYGGSGSGKSTILNQLGGVRTIKFDEEKSLIAKFGEGATKSGATLKGIFEKAIGKKEKKEK